MERLPLRTGFDVSGLMPNVLDARMSALLHTFMQYTMEDAAHLALKRGSDEIADADVIPAMKYNAHPDGRLWHGSQSEEDVAQWYARLTDPNADTDDDSVDDGNNADDDSVDDGNNADGDSMDDGNAQKNKGVVNHAHCARILQTAAKWATWHPSDGVYQLLKRAVDKADSATGHVCT